MNHHNEVFKAASIPFILMLLSIAILPLTCHKWWESNFNKLKISLLFGIPTLFYLLIYHHIHKLLDVMIFEYIPFIILLGSLFIISGGIFVEGDIEATPINNALFLIVGGILASFIGTTGAAMLLIRPFLNTNSERKYKIHSVVFFIFIVCNTGGCLTPLGDPPIFLGYLLGVPFFWTIKNLFWGWFLINSSLIIIYFIIDAAFYKKETISSLTRDKIHVVPLKIEGVHNFIYLFGVISLVAFINHSYLNFIPEKNDPYILNSYFSFLREVGMIILSFLSLLTTKKVIRQKNHFNFGPIEEVAILFLGIFITMIPALLLLEQSGEFIKRSIDSPAKFFWATGFLSSFLDNAPTYLTFFTAAGINPQNVYLSPTRETLMAISLGAIFMGANTYIGNGPNFMVKVISEERKIKMPSFFGYMIYSILILIPLFLIFTVILNSGLL